MTSSQQGLSGFICRFKAVFMGINFTLQWGGGVKAQFMPVSCKRKISCGISNNHHKSEDHI